MHPDVNTAYYRRAIRKLLQLLRSCFQNLEWLSLVVLAMLPGEAFERNEGLKLGFSVVGALCLFAGLTLRIWSRGFEKNGHFVLDGPYRFVQNPDELGSVLLYIGSFFVMGIMWSWVFAFVVFSLVYFACVSSIYEESLKKKVGTTFPRYRSRVRRWIPALYPAVNRSKTSFHWKKAFGKESSTWLWLVGLGLVYFYFAIR
jgi:protein-S-isoprenylcysteine O-methyltransferase Ste14